MNEEISVKLKADLNLFKQQLGKVKGIVDDTGKNAKIRLGIDTKNLSAQQQLLLIQIEEVEKRIKKLQGAYARQKPIAGAVSDPKPLIKAQAELERLENRFKSIGKAGTKAGQSIKKSFDKMDFSKTFKDGFKSAKRFTLSLFGIHSVYRMLSRASSSYLAQDQETSQKIQSAWVGLGSIFAPLLNTIANFVLKAVKYLDLFWTAFTGKGFLTNAMNKATKKAGAGVKALNKQLAGFDEITNIGDTSGGGGVAEPSWADAFADVKLDDTLVAKIEKMGEAFDRLKSKAGELKDVLIEKVKETFPSLIPIFDNLKGLIGGVWEDMKTSWDKHGNDIKTSLKGAWNNAKTIYINNADFILGKVKDTTESMLNVWKSHGEEFADKVGQSWNNLADTLKKVIDFIEENVFKPFREAFDNTWEKIKPLIEKLQEAFVKLGIKIMDLWNDVLKPVVDFLLKIFAPIFTYLSSLIGGVFGSILLTITSVITSIINIISGVIDFIVGIFTGNWKRAWQGVKDVFVNIISSLGAVFKLPINLIIDGINAFTRALNKIKIPDWVPGVGGKGFNIKLIPKLAQGTNYVPEDTLAHIHKGEAVVPAKFNKAEFFGSGNQETNALLETLISRVEEIEINPYTTIKDVGKSSVDYINQQKRILGRGVI